MKATFLILPVEGPPRVEHRDDRRESLATLQAYVGGT